MNHIVVVGSINMDLICEVSSYPKLGETLTGQAFSTQFGGKGANQAIAAARLGAKVTMLGAVGQDTYGELLLENFRTNRVDTTYIKRCDAHSGIANITVADHDNAIVVVPGANAHVDCSYIEAHHEVLLQADLIVMQLEIPMDTVCAVARFAKAAGIPVLLNPAPAQSLPEGLLADISYLIPNRHEVASLFSESMECVLANYPEKLIVSAGSDGAYVFSQHRLQHLLAVPTHVVDTTGAGDALHGGFAYGIVQGWDVVHSLRFGMNVAACAITKLGAQTALPYREEVEDETKTNH
ncbi:MAG: ribokinase [Erysipelotrichaceae bacterium]